VESLGTALLAIACAIAIALWAYGVYCYVQMVRHRVSGANPFRVAWPPDRLTERGREYRGRALQVYLWFVILALVILLLTRLLTSSSTPPAASLP
jgi:ABC-type branched-subunit amino acid transport system permease subunit